jgi:hypothetical protein
MSPADELATDRQSARAAAGLDTRLDEQSRLSLEDLLRPSTQREPAGDSQSIVSRIDYLLGHQTSEPKAEVKRRGWRGFVGYLAVICVGAAAISAWQSSGETQMISSWVQQHGWTKPSASPETTAVQASVPETPQLVSVAQTAPKYVPPTTPATVSVDQEQVHQIGLDLAALRQTVEQLAAQTAPEYVPPTAPATVSVDQEQVHQMGLDLATLRQTVEQLAAGQAQMAREITALQTSDKEILEKIPAPPLPRPIAAPAVKAHVHSTPANAHGTTVVPRSNSTYRPPYRFTPESPYGPSVNGAYPLRRSQQSTDPTR